MSARRILKFGVSPMGSTIETADDPRFLSVGVQGDAVVVWVEATVGTGRRTAVVGALTGDHAPLPETEATYVGTVQFGNGTVVHVYHGPTL